MCGRSSYHSIDGHVVVVQRHAGRAGVAVDRVVQVRVGRDSAFTGEAGEGGKRAVYS